MQGGAFQEPVGCGSMVDGRFDQGGGEGGELFTGGECACKLQETSAFFHGVAKKLSLQKHNRDIGE